MGCCTALKYSALSGFLKCLKSESSEISWRKSRAIIKSCGVRLPEQ